MRSLVLSVAVLLYFVALPLAAQSDQDILTYATLIGTPAGALPPLLSNAMLGQSAESPNVSGRLGHISTAGTGFTTYAASVGMPVGTRATIGVTAGFQDIDCDGCKGRFLAGASAEGRLASATLGTGANAARLTIGLNGEFGFGKPEGVTLTSLTAGLPIAVVAGSSTLKVAPFVTPGLGWGHGSGDPVGSQSGTRFMLGGGVALRSATSPLGVNFGFQKVFIKDGDTLFGLNVTFALPRG